MTALFEILFSLPTVVFTVPMGFVLLYWMSVVVGAADLDPFNGALDGTFEGMEGALEGVDGAIDGALDGALDGAADGAVEGAADGADAGEVEAEADTEPTGFFGLRWLAFLLRLGKVPITITATLLVFTGWCAAFFGDYFFGASTLLTGLSLDAAILTGSLSIGTALTNVLSRPLEPVFKVALARDRKSLVGEVCEVDTGKVNERFGQAKAMVDGDDLLFHIRCDTKNNQLARGSRALIISYDKVREAYVVEPIDARTSTSSSASAAHRVGQPQRSSEG